MKKYFFIFVSFLMSFSHKTVFAQDNSVSILGIENDRMRSGNISIDDLPKVIAYTTNVIIGFAGTISVILLIYYALQMQINSGITGDSGGADKARKGMIAAGVGFLISVMAWFAVAWFFSILNTF